MTASSAACVSTWAAEFAFQHARAVGHHRIVIVSASAERTSADAIFEATVWRLARGYADIELTQLSANQCVEQLNIRMANSSM